MNKRKKLTWKYFLRNKFLEIVGVLVLIFGLIPLGKIFGCWSRIMHTETVCTTFDYWGQGLAIVLALVLGSGIIYILIKENWRWAERQADRKLEK